MRELITSAFAKTISEKKFLKSEAESAVEQLTKHESPFVLVELHAQTQSPNPAISELAMKTLLEYLDKYPNFDFDAPFLKTLAKNCEGKRALIQKGALKILSAAKDKQGEKALQAMIDKELSEEESVAIKRELSLLGVKKEKPVGSLKDFIKMKKETIANTPEDS